VRPLALQGEAQRASPSRASAVCSATRRPRSRSSTRTAPPPDAEALQAQARCRRGPSRRRSARLATRGERRLLRHGEGAGRGRRGRPRQARLVVPAGQVEEAQAAAPDESRRRRGGCARPRPPQLEDGLGAGEAGSATRSSPRPGPRGRGLVAGDHGQPQLGQLGRGQRGPGSHAAGPRREGPEAARPSRPRRFFTRPGPARPRPRASRRRRPGPHTWGPGGLDDVPAPYLGRAHARAPVLRLAAVRGLYTGGHARLPTAPAACRARPAEVRCPGRARSHRREPGPGVTRARCESCCRSGRSSSTARRRLLRARGLRRGRRLGGALLPGRRDERRPEVADRPGPRRWPGGERELPGPGAPGAAPARRGGEPPRGGRAHRPPDRDQGSGRRAHRPRLAHGERGGGGRAGPAPGRGETALVVPTWSCWWGTRACSPSTCAR